MIGSLNGIIYEKNPDYILLEVQGVGYEVEIPASSLCYLPNVGELAKLHIHTHVREDAIRLFGFLNAFDKKVFLSLINVSGIGPKAALALLGPVDGKELCDIVIQQRVERLVAIPGIGQKTAERIILELKAKFQKLQTRENVLYTNEVAHIQNQALEDLKSALANLGYKDKQYQAIIEGFAKKINLGESITFEAAFKESLKKLSEHILKK